MDEAAKQHLSAQLVKLGDMMGDGMHYEPGGAWIAKEYKKVARALGYGPKRTRMPGELNKAMAEFLAKTPCPKCGGALKQTRSGSRRAQCQSCQAKYQCGTKKGVGNE